MAIIQTDVARGFREVSQPHAANTLNTARFHLDLSAVGLTTADIAEMGILPMHCRVRSMTVIPAGLGAGININAGIMSGNPGDTDPTRTVGSQFFSAQAVNATPVQMSAATGYNLAPTAAARSIGIVPDANITAGAGKSITLLVDYYQ